MSTRTVEVFTAGCPACDPTVKLVQEMACESCDVQVRDMNDAQVAERARELGVTRVPTVVVNGKLASCCAIAAPNRDALAQAGIGQHA